MPATSQVISVSTWVHTYRSAYNCSSPVFPGLSYQLQIYSTVLRKELDPRDCRPKWCAL